MNEEVVRDKSPSQMKLKLTFAILILAALFIIELYFMMNFPDSYLVIGIIGLAILCFVYLITDINFKLQDEKETYREKEYESIYKGEKVNYILMKQGFQDLEDIIKGNKLVVDFPVDDLVHAQKAVGKVTIQRGKENTTAILNSNEKLMDRIIAFEDKLEEINHLISSNQTLDPQELASNLNETKNSIQNTVYELSENIQPQINSISSTFDEMKKLIASVDEKASAIDEIRKFTEVVDKKASAFDEMKKLIASVEQKSSDFSMMQERTAPMFRETIKETVPEIIPENLTPVEEPMVMPEPVMEEAVLPNEPIAAEKNNIMIEEEPMAIPEPIEVDTISPINPAVMEEPVKIPEPVVEEKSPLPDMSDPGHVMTPEEIAALLGNM